MTGLKEVAKKRFWESLATEVASKGVAVRSMKANGPIKPGHVKSWAEKAGYAVKVEGLLVTVARQVT